VRLPCGRALARRVTAPTGSPASGLLRRRQDPLRPPLRSPCLRLASMLAGYCRTSRPATARQVPQGPSPRSPKPRRAAGVRRGVSPTVGAASVSVADRRPRIGPGPAGLSGVGSWPMLARNQGARSSGWGASAGTGRRPHAPRRARLDPLEPDSAERSGQLLSCRG
jgi:hypothetical protein